MFVRLTQAILPILPPAKGGLWPVGGWNRLGLPSHGGTSHGYPLPARLAVLHPVIAPGRWSCTDELLRARSMLEAPRCIRRGNIPDQVVAAFAWFS